MFSKTIEQCQAMLKYLGADSFKFKHTYDSLPLPIHPMDDRIHKVFTFNSDGTVDYAGYRSHSSDRWVAGADVERKNITPNQFLMEAFFKKMKNKSLDKARCAAMKHYLDRQLCVGGLGFLIK
jgi:hypothetical protein